MLSTEGNILRDFRGLFQHCKVCSGCTVGTIVEGEQNKLTTFMVLTTIIQVNKKH